MDIFTGIIVYLLIWWTALFMVLPWRAQRPDEHQVGNTASAPDNPRLKQKFIITSILSAVFWVIIFTLIQMNIIDFRKIGFEMMSKAQAQDTVQDATLNTDNETIIVQNNPCLAFARHNAVRSANHIPDHSVSANYTPGVDAYGRPVLGADTTPDPFKLLERVRIPIGVDLAEFLGIAAPTGLELFPDLGDIEVDTRTGQAFIDGQNVTDGYQSFCNDAANNPLDADRTDVKIDDGDIIIKTINDTKTDLKESID